MPPQLLADAMGAGARLWGVVWPGELMTGPAGGGPSTIYKGERPWVVLGETGTGDLLAAPLNDAANPKWFTPVVSRAEVLMPGSSKDAQLELAHVWSLPASLAREGSLAPAARQRVLEAIRKYF